MLENLTIVLEEGLVAMCTGMGVVFGFLIVLVFAMQIMSKIVLWLNKIFPEAVIETAKKKVKKAVTGMDEEVAVAIAAVAHRK